MKRTACLPQLLELGTDPKRFAKVRRTESHLIKRYMENLCEDLIFNILICLPVKHLLSATLVCRPWLAVTRSPTFCKTHYSRHSSSNSKFCVQNGSKFRLYDLENRSPGRALVAFDPSGPLVLATSGGVILVRYPIYINYVKRMISLMARNPLTRQYAILPPLPLVDDATVFDEVLSRGATIAYIPDTGEYKVVCPYGESSSRIVCFFVLTLGSNMSWRRIDPNSTIFPNGIHDDGPYSVLKLQSVSAGGIIYFYDQMFAVDLRNENIHRVGSLPSLPILRLPRDPSNTESLDSIGSNFTDYKYYKYFKMGEHLGRFEHVKYTGEDIFSVAILKGFGSSNCYWSELILDRNLLIQETRRGLRDFRCPHDQVAWLEDPETLIFSSYSTQFVTYDVKSKEINYIGYLSWNRDSKMFVHTSHFARW